MKMEKSTDDTQFPVGDIVFFPVSNNDTATVRDLNGTVIFTVPGKPHRTHKHAVEVATCLSDMLNQAYRASLP